MIDMQSTHNCEVDFSCPEQGKKLLFCYARGQARRNSERWGGAAVLEEKVMIFDEHGGILTTVVG